MNEPLYMDDYRPSVEYAAVCTTCCHEWWVVQPIGGHTNHLECPECGHWTGGKVKETES